MSLSFLLTIGFTSYSSLMDRPLRRSVQLQENNKTVMNLMT